MLMAGSNAVGGNLKRRRLGQHVLHFVMQP